MVVWEHTGRHGGRLDGRWAVLELCAQEGAQGCRDGSRWYCLKGSENYLSSLIRIGKGIPLHMYLSKHKTQLYSMIVTYLHQRVIVGVMGDYVV